MELCVAAETVATRKLVHTNMLTGASSTKRKKQFIHDEEGAREWKEKVGIRYFRRHDHGKPRVNSVLFFIIRKMTQQVFGRYESGKEMLTNSFYRFADLLALGSIEILVVTNSQPFFLSFILMLWNFFL